MKRAFPVPRFLFNLPLAIAAVFLLPLGQPAAARAQDVRGFDTVIIDAGHGGHDRGGVPGQRGIAEKTATLDTAFRLQRVLRNRGFRVIMTRTSDDFISLGQRTGATRGWDRRRTIFVSIHFNSAPREGARGIETYYYRGDSFGLAARLHQSLVENMETEDRFLRRRPFYVIRNAAIPAVLLECGFLTNGDEERRIAGSRYRQRLADSIASGLLAQRGAGNLAELGDQPRVTSARIGSSRSRSSRRYVSRGSARHGRRSAISSRRGGGRGKRYAIQQRGGRHYRRR